jgi:sugar lactone lactonase YvrE
MPVGLVANSVASLSDGTLLATVLMHPGFTFTDVFSGKPTGAIYEWSPGDPGFELIRGTELPGNNGIEVSLDGREIFVVSTGQRTISVFSYDNPASLLRSTQALDFGPDNLHMTAEGQLLTAGPSNDEHDCGELDLENIDLKKFASCPRGFVAAAFDPKSLAETMRVSGPANPDFSNATMALQVGEEIWIGSFSGDRIGVAPKSP